MEQLRLLNKIILRLTLVVGGITTIMVFGFLCFMIIFNSGSEPETEEMLMPFITAIPFGVVASVALLGLTCVTGLFVMQDDIAKIKSLVEKNHENK